MKIILNHKRKAKIVEDIINNLSLIKSYLDIQRLQEYIDFEDVIIQLKQSIKISENLYEELSYLYRKLSENNEEKN